MSRSTTQKGLHGNSTLDAQISACSGARRAKRNRLPPVDLDRSPHRHRNAVQRGPEIRSGHRNDRGLFKRKRAAHKCHFQSRRPLRIADQPIADTQRNGIGRSGS